MDVINDSIAHLIEKLRNPGSSNDKQTEFNKQRFEAVVNAKKQVPQFVTVRNDLPAQASTIPKKGNSDEVEFDTIIFGAITDAENRNGNFYRRRQDESFIDVGREKGSRLSFDAVAGKSVAAAGFAGVGRFAPFVVPAKKALTVELYQEENVADTVHTVFTGLRVFPADAIETKLTSDEVDD